MKPINIPGYEHYLITKDGRIFNTIGSRGILKNPKELKSYPNKNTSYLTAVIRSNYKAKAVYVHRLVAETYLEKPSDEHIEVNHKNFNKTDNRLENLEWVTPSGNREHMIEAYGGTRENFIKNLLKNEKLVRVGIKVYNITQSLVDIQDIWDCNEDTAREALKRLEVYNKNSGKSKLPYIQTFSIKKDIQKEIENNKIIGRKNLFTKNFIEFLNQKYDKKFARTWLFEKKAEVLREIEYNKTINE